MSLHAWVVTGGEPPETALLDELVPPQLVVAADSGADIALGLGLVPDVIVGDFDSVTPAGAAAAGEQRRFPTDKDATDLALALAEARHRGAGSISVVGGSGGRLDHFLANVAVLASDELAAVRVDALMGSARLWVVRRTGRRSAALSATLSRCWPTEGPRRGSALRVCAGPWTARRWRRVPAEASANTFAAPEATVSLDSGVVLAIRP